MDGHQRAAIGRAAEAAAEAFLVESGMRMVERDVRLVNGQLDLVMLDRDCLVVVEVKARRGSTFGTPEEAVDWRKLNRLRLLAETYRQHHPRLGAAIRVDVVAVDLDQNGRPARFRHLADVLW